MQTAAPQEPVIFRAKERDKRRAAAGVFGGTVAAILGYCAIAGETRWGYLLSLPFFGALLTTGVYLASTLTRRLAQIEFHADALVIRQGKDESRVPWRRIEQARYDGRGEGRWLISVGEESAWVEVSTGHFDASTKQNIEELLREKLLAVGGIDATDVALRSAAVNFFTPRLKSVLRAGHAHCGTSGQSPANG